MEKELKKGEELIVPVTRGTYMMLHKQAGNARRYKEFLKKFIVLTVILIALVLILGITNMEQKKQIEALKEQTELLRNEITLLEVKLLNEQKEQELEEEQTQAVEEETETAPAEQANAYPLSEQEREAVQGVVMAEAGGQDYWGQVLVAQCIRNACEIDGLSPLEAIQEYQYAEPKNNATDEVVQAVADVFDQDVKYTNEPIMFFYAPATTNSKWHESQDYVLTHEGHKFFAKKV